MHHVRQGCPTAMPDFIQKTDGRRQPTRGDGRRQPRLLRCSPLLCAAVAALYASWLHAEPPRRADEPEIRATPEPAANAKPARGVKEIRGPRDLLGMYGVDESHWRGFFPGRDVGQDETEGLLRALYAVRRFSLEQIEHWVDSKARWSDWVDEPQQHQGAILLLRGRLRKVQRIKTLPELVERLDIEHYYRCEIQIADGGPLTIVYALHVPQAWNLDQPMDESVSWRGFFVKLANAVDAPPVPVWICQRVAWHCDQGKLKRLGNLGMDVGLLDDVTNRSAISGQERECFYQLLAAVGRANTADLKSATRRRYKVEPLFNRPDEAKGQLVALHGTTRRAILIRIEDQDIVTRFGLDHYYELELFTDDSQGNPLVFCLRDLPADFPTGDDIFENVRIAGFFLKTWKYRIHSRAGEAARSDSARRQLAPLLVAKDVEWLTAHAQESSPYAYLVGFVIVASIAVAWIVVWRLNRSDDRFRKQALSRRDDKDIGAALQELSRRDQSA